jgi:hypothetical protein
VDAPLAPPPAIRLPDAEPQVVTTVDDVRNATADVAASAQRLMSIFTPDMEPLIYDQTAFLEITKRFVLGRAFGKVRVLVRDSGRMNASNNRFVAMARRLSSYLEIRLLTAELQQQTAAYCIADDRAIIYRLRADRWDGVYSLNDPPVARQFLQDFDVAWQASGDPQRHVSNL